MSEPNANIPFLRFAAMNVVVAGTAGWMLLSAPLAVAIMILSLGVTAVADEKIGDTRRSYSRGMTLLMDAPLYLMLPCVIFLALCHMTAISSGDPFGLGGLASAVVRFDVLAWRDATHPALLALAFLPAGILYGAAGINVAHELFHRLHSPAALITARWLLAFSCDTTFAIEHVYGHHRNVGTPADPATARRGESYYRFFLRSSLGEIGNGFRLEANRLRNRKLPVLSWHNRALRGQLMSLAVAAAYVYAAGLWGLAAFLAAAVTGKAYLEATNYIEHYGLVRVPGQRVEARHSWDSYRKVTGAFLFNLPRHADHHLHADKTYWHLTALPEAPELPYGYQALMLLALVPSRYFAVMDPLLKRWDETMASEAERKLIASQA